MWKFEVILELGRWPEMIAAQAQSVRLLSVQLPETRHSRPQFPKHLETGLCVPSTIWCPQEAVL